VISRALRTLAIAVPLSLAVAVPAAHAGSLYTPDVQALSTGTCDGNTFLLDLDGAQLNSHVTGYVQFDKHSQITIDNEVVNGTGKGGAAEWHFTHAIPSRTKKVTYSITYNRVEVPHSQETHTETYALADLCPDLPVTGGNAAPVGKVALGVTLGGALLAAVAIRRRPRKTTAA
jgi:hypothetical protein